MKLDKHYIDEKELWKVTIKLEESQIGVEKVSFLIYNFISYFILFLSLVPSW